MIIDGTSSQKINELYFLMHPDFFIFDRMTKKERELYKEASLVKTNNKIIVQKFRVQFTHSSGRAPILVANNYFCFIIPKLTVKRFRNAPMAIALESHPQPKNHVPGSSQPSQGSQFKRILSYQTSTYCE